MTVIEERLPDNSFLADFAALYGGYGEASFRQALRITGNRELAAEVVQEPFLSAWKARAAYECERGEVGPWLRTFVRHRAVDFVRQSV